MVTKTFQLIAGFMALWALTAQAADVQVVKMEVFDAPCADGGTSVSSVVALADECTKLLEGTSFLGSCSPSGEFQLIPDDTCEAAPDKTFTDACTDGDNVDYSVRYSCDMHPEETMVTVSLGNGCDIDSGISGLQYKAILVLNECLPYPRPPLNPTDREGLYYKAMVYTDNTFHLLRYDMDDCSGDPIDYQTSVIDECELYQFDQPETGSETDSDTDLRRRLQNQEVYMLAVATVPGATLAKISATEAPSSSPTISPTFSPTIKTRSPSFSPTRKTSAPTTATPTTATPTLSPTDTSSANALFMNLFAAIPVFLLLLVL